MIEILAADAVTPETSALWAPLAQLGVVGLVLGYVGRSLIPRLFEALDTALKAFAIEQEKARLAFAAEMKAQREACAVEQSAQRAHDEKRSSEIHARIDDLASEVRSLSNRAA